MADSTAENLQPVVDLDAASKLASPVVQAVFWRGPQRFWRRWSRAGALKKKPSWRFLTDDKPQKP